MLKAAITSYRNLFDAFIAKQAENHDPSEMERWSEIEDHFSSWFYNELCNFASKYAKIAYTPVSIFLCHRHVYVKWSNIKEWECLISIDDLIDALD